ncbi:MAG: glycosyltransferase family 9 protein [Elusimicrobiota bacterium]|jgi:ADP-heptose:LPS heptosyltransferase|nr:glycosyltransferase family 9 protein [Elusimicrobiota bacterium]
MKIQTKMAIDRLAGLIICILFIPIALTLGKILRRNHSITPANVKNIVVAKYFGLGSISQSLPMLKALKTAYPNANLIYLSRKANAPLLELAPFVDKTLYLSDKTLTGTLLSSLEILWTLWKLPRIDLFFDLEIFSSYGALISLFSLARNRLGFFWARSTKFKTYIHTHLVYFNFSMPLRLTYMQLARLGGADVNSKNSLVAFNIDQSTQVLADQKLCKITQNPYDKILAFNVNASDLSYARRWPLKNFAQTAIHFMQQGYFIVLLGSKGEKDYVEQMIKEVSGYTDLIFNAAGYFSLAEVLALLPKFVAFLTNDTGLMNLAFAQNAKVAALYGPNIPDYTFIANDVNVAIYKKSFCSPCLYIFEEPICGQSYFCMENIETQDVVLAIETLLKAGPPKEQKEEGINSFVQQNDGSYVYGTLRRRQ